MTWDKPFKCTGCGACCHRAYRVGLPLKDDMQTCKHLTDENLCGIYEERPWVCRVDQVFKTKKMGKREFFIETSKKCNEMMKEDGLDVKYHINIKEEYGV